MRGGSKRKPRGSGGLRIAPPGSLDEAIEAFATEREKLGYSRPRQHLGPLELLQRVIAARLGETEPDARDIALRDLTAVLDVYVGKGLKAVTVHGAGSVLQVFCRWLVKRNVLLLDPSRELLLPRKVRRIGYVPTPAEVERLLARARPESALLREGVESEAAPLALRRQREKKAWTFRRSLVLAVAQRDTALLEVLYGSGIRYGEACRLDTEDLDLKERTLFIRSGKGRKDRIVPVTGTAARALSCYLEEGRSFLFAPKTPALFLMASGARLSGWWCKGPLARLLQAAGLSRRLAPHRLRHACAVHLLERGADIVLIARLLGHERLDVTALYLSLSPQAIDRALLSAHPREKRSRHRRKDSG